MTLHEQLTMDVSKKCSALPVMQSGRVEYRDVRPALLACPSHRKQLETMNARFTDRLERAFELGLENRKSAAARVNLPARLWPRGAATLGPQCDSRFDLALFLYVDGGVEI